MNIHGINLTRREIVCLSILITFSLFCTYKMAIFCLSGGILNPDVSLYLISALKYAGMDYYNLARPEELFYTPVISFLSSLLFRLGLVDKSAIIIVTSIFCFFSYIGLYFLLKIRFNSLISLVGVIIYGSTSVIIFNLSKGLIDILSISLSVWVLYFAIRAIDDNPKFFLISFPLLVIGFFTKYIAGFILPLIFLYYVIDRNVIDNFDKLLSKNLEFKVKIKEYLYSNEFKYLFISLLISFIIAFIISKTLILDYGGHLTFFEQTFNTFNLNHSGSVNFVFSQDKSLYFDEFSNIIFEKREFGLLLSGLLYSIFGISIIILAINFIKNRDNFHYSKGLYMTKHFDKILLILLICSLVGVFYGFKVLENNMFSNICFLVFITIFQSIFKKYLDDDKCLNFYLLFIAYFIIYFIFLSLYPLKLYRYSLPLIIPFVCIIVSSLDIVLSFFSNNGCPPKLNFG